MATNLVVDSKLSQGVDAFINEVDDDFKAPHQSTFQDYMPKVKRDVQSMEEVSQHNGTSIKYALIFLQFKILINKYYHIIACCRILQETQIFFFVVYI